MWLCFPVDGADRYPLYQVAHRKHQFSAVFGVSLSNWLPRRKALPLSTIAVDKFVDKLMTWLISHLFVRIFSFLANFCTIKKPFDFNRIAQRPMFTGVCTAELRR